MEPAGGNPTGAPRERFPRAARIRKGEEIVHLLRRGNRERTPHLEVFFAPSSGGFPRYGTIVPKHRHTVVERNLVRRRLREIGRRTVLPALAEAGCDLDVLVRARPSAYTVGFPELLAELAGITEGLCSKASSSD